MATPAKQALIEVWCGISNWIEIKLAAEQEDASAAIGKTSGSLMHLI